MRRRKAILRKMQNAALLSMMQSYAQTIQTP